MSKYFDHEMLLGVPIKTWFRVLNAAKCRCISVDDLVDSFELQNPIPTDYYAWKQRHGVLAEVLELQEGYEE